jgi:hypothetical protein
MKIRLLVLGLWLSAFTSQASGQNLQIRDVFKQMPDSLMPYLTQNNRLDFLDFLDSNMKAEVRNRFGGTSEMTGLSSDSLSIRMSSSLRSDLFLMPLSSPLDSVTSTVVMIETFLADSIHGQSRVSYFTPEWKPLSSAPPLGDIQQKRIQTCMLQNIVKKDEEIVNKY